MKKYKQIYKDHYSLSETENNLCESCGVVAVDIHHLLFRSHQGKDNIENLIGLCRACHNKAHADKEFNNNLILIKSIEFPNYEKERKI